MQLTNNEREFRFNSGFSVRILESFSSRLYELSMMEWGRQTPPPPVPVVTEEIPWANAEGGKRQIERPNADDPSYIQALNVWGAQQERYARNYLNQHVDINSLDPRVLEIAMGEMSKGGVKPDPVSAYLSFVHDSNEQPGTEQKDAKGKPIPDTGLTELGQFYKWMREIDSGGGAMIERYLHLFRSEDNRQAGAGAHRNGMAGAAGAVAGQGAADPAAPANHGDGGGGTLGG